MIAPLYISDEAFAGWHRKVAAFDDEAFVSYVFDRHLRLRVQDLRPSREASARDIVEWLASAYGQPVIADDVEPATRAMWGELQASGLVRGWSERAFEGATVQGPVVRVRSRWSPEPPAPDGSAGTGAEPC